MQDESQEKRRIKTNKIRCKFCGDVLESMFTHDFQLCSCGSCFTDGGHYYIRRGFPPDMKPEDAYEDLTEYEE